MSETKQVERIWLHQLPPVVRWILTAILIVCIAGVVAGELMNSALYRVFGTVFGGVALAILVAFVMLVTVDRQKRMIYLRLGICPIIGFPYRLGTVVVKLISHDPVFKGGQRRHVVYWSDQASYADGVTLMDGLKPSSYKLFSTTDQERAKALQGRLADLVARKKQ